MNSEESEEKSQPKDNTPSSKYQTPKNLIIPTRVGLSLRIPENVFQEMKSTPDATPRKKSYLNTPKGAGDSRKQSFSSKINELDVSDVVKDRRSSIPRDYSYSPSKPINREIISDKFDPARVERLLRKFPRQPHEAKRLADFLTKWNPYFRSLTEGENGLSLEAIFQICQKMEFEEYPAGQAVIKEGDPSNKKFYIIYSGEAAVVVKKMNVYVEMNLKVDSARGSMMKATTEKLDLPDTSSSSSSNEGSDSEYTAADNTKNRNSRMSMSTDEDLIKGRVGLGNMARKSIFSHAASKIQVTTLEVVHQHSIPSLTIHGTSPSHAGHSENTGSRRNTHLTVSRKDSNHMPVSPHSPNMSNFAESLQTLDSPGLKSSDKKKSSFLKIPSMAESASPQKGIGRQSFTFKNDQPSIKLLPTPGSSIVLDNPMKNSRRRLSSINMKFFQEQAEQPPPPKEEPKPKKKKEKTEDEIRERSMKKLAKYGHVKDIIYKDFTFGERALIDDTPRGATIFTLLPTKLLAIKAEEFKLIQQNYEPEKKRIFEFMIKTFPDLDQINQIETVRDYIYLLDKKSFDTGNSIVQEGEHGEIFYLLYQGHVELSKKVYIKENIKSLQFTELNTHMRVKPNFKTEIKICNVETPGTFLCEEVLFEKRCRYHYTIKSLSSPAILFAVSKKFFWGRATPTTRSMMQKNFMEKCRERVDIIHKKLEMKFADPKITLESFGDVEGGTLEEKFLTETQIVRDKIMLETTAEKGSSIKSKLKMKTLASKLEPKKSDFQLEIHTSPSEAIFSTSKPNLFSTTTTNFRSLATRNLISEGDPTPMLTTGHIHSPSNLTSTRPYFSFKSPRNLKSTTTTTMHFQSTSNDFREKKIDSTLDPKNGSQVENSNMQSRDYDQLKSILELGNDIKIAAGRVPKKLILKNKNETQGLKVRSEGYEIATLEKNYLMSPIKRVTSPKAQFDNNFPVEEIDKFRLDAAEIDERMQKRFAIQKLLELPKKSGPKAVISTTDRNLMRIFKMREKIKLTSNSEFSAIDLKLRHIQKISEREPSPLPKDDDEMDKFFVTSQDFRTSTLREKEKKKKTPGTLKPPSLWNLESLSTIPPENDMPLSAKGRETIYIGNPPRKEKERHLMKNFSQSEMLKFKHKTNNRLKTKLTILTSREVGTPKKVDNDSPHTLKYNNKNTMTMTTHRPNTFR